MQRKVIKALSSDSRVIIDECLNFFHTLYKHADTNPMVQKCARAIAELHSAEILIERVYDIHMYEHDFSLHVIHKGMQFLEARK